MRFPSSSHRPCRLCLLGLAGLVDLAGFALPVLACLFFLLFLMTELYQPAAFPVYAFFVLPLSFFYFLRQGLCIFIPARHPDEPLGKYISGVSTRDFLSAQMPLPYQI